jgi:hypothetical protein
MVANEIAEGSKVVIQKKTGEQEIIRLLTMVR